MNKQDKNFIMKGIMFLFNIIFCVRAEALEEETFAILFGILAIFQLASMWLEISKTKK